MESHGLLPVPIFINGVEAHTIVRDVLTSVKEDAATRESSYRAQDAASVDFDFEVSAKAAEVVQGEEIGVGVHDEGHLVHNAFMHLKNGGDVNLGVFGCVALCPRSGE